MERQRGKGGEAQIDFPLADLIKWAEPTGNARYVELVTLNNPQMMPGQRHKTLMFNGYAEQVGQLYSGMYLRKHF